MSLLSSTRPILYTLLALFMLDCLFEMSFIGATVAYKHKDHPMSVQGAGSDGPVILKGKPLGIMTDQGHTSNGAAGTGIILVGIPGFLLFGLQKRLKRKDPQCYFRLLTSYVVLAILALLLTLGALAYTFTLERQTSGQDLHLDGLVSPIRYPYDDWTPQTWYSAVLNQLEFVTPTSHSKSVVIDGNRIDYSDRGDVESILRVIKGWKWNLIPMFLLQFGVTTLIVVEYLVIRRERAGHDSSAITENKPNVRD